MTEVVLHHCVSCALDLLSILSNICLLIVPRLFLAGLINLHFGLFSKLSLWSLSEMKPGCRCVIFVTLLHTPSLVVISSSSLVISFRRSDHLTVRCSCSNFSLMIA